MKISKYNNSEVSTGLLFWKVSVLWQRKIKEILQPLNLTHTQFVILAVVEELSEKIQEVTQKKISDFSMIDVMTISSTIRLLEKKNFIIRTQSETDMRAYTITNTLTGKKILQKAIEKVEFVDDSFFFEDIGQQTILQKNLQTLIDKNNIENE